MKCKLQNSTNHCTHRQIGQTNAKSKQPGANKNRASYSEINIVTPFYTPCPTYQQLVPPFAHLAPPTNRMLHRSHTLPHLPTACLTVYTTCPTYQQVVSPFTHLAPPTNRMLHRLHTLPHLPTACLTVYTTCPTYQQVVPPFTQLAPPTNMLPKRLHTLPHLPTEDAD